MTIEEILECSAEKLEAMSDIELINYFKPFFNVTRPELAPKPTNGVRVTQPVVDFKTRQNIEKLAELGIDVSHLLKGKRR